MHKLWSYILKYHAPNTHPLDKNKVIYKVSDISMNLNEFVH